MKSRIGLALGSGSARGWSHIGVLRALAERGVEPDIVCGCSIGALVGAAYVDGDLDKLERWVATLTWQDVLGLLDVSLVGGLIKGDKLVAFFERHFVDKDFAALPKPFACVATDLENGREVWLREGSVASAVRASIALPGLFKPSRCGDRLLVDGGLVNPVPVSLCRALGADLVIAVDLGSDRIGHPGPGRKEPVAREPWWRRIGGGSGAGPLPSVADTISTSIHIMQVRIARSRMAGDPPDVAIAPRLAQLGLMDYHRGSEAIAEGRAAVERLWPAIQHALEGAAP